MPIIVAIKGPSCLPLGNKVDAPLLVKMAVNTGSFANQKEAVLRGMRESECLVCDQPLGTVVPVEAATEMTNA